ncbi:MAG: prepilin-type N-terminal cleavage/methylation domain-containing protein [Candidatus Saccharimonadales bacterium]
MLMIGRKQRGDTIIEVMVSLAVLGLAFAVSYATANRSLAVSQTNQEHSRALELLSTQVELARSYVTNPDLYNTSGQWFCMHYDEVTKAVAIQRYSVDNNIADAPSDCQAPVNSSINYTIYASYEKRPDASSPVDQDIFKFTIDWPGLGTLGQQQEQINYKLHEQISADSLGVGGGVGGGGGGVGGGGGGGGGGGVGGGGAPAPAPWPASIVVTVKQMRPGPGNTTPSCTTANINGASSASNMGVKLADSGGASYTQSTDSSSTTTFSGLTGGDLYTASIAQGDYLACNSPSVRAVNKATIPLGETLIAQPICKQVYEQTGTQPQWGIVGYHSVLRSRQEFAGYQYVYSHTAWFSSNRGSGIYPGNGTYWTYAGGSWYYSQYVQQAVYNTVYYYDSVPDYGWIYTPVYGYVNKCPPF